MNNSSTAQNDATLYCPEIGILNYENSRKQNLSNSQLAPVKVYFSKTKYFLEFYCNSQNI